MTHCLRPSRPWRHLITLFYKTAHRTALLALAGACLLPLLVPPLFAALQPIPDRLVVLTFDDSVSSHHRVVRPLLKELGFGATFFITEGFSFRTNKQDYMTWEQIAELHRDGFEIGNHTRDHMAVSRDTLGLLGEQVGVINDQCRQHGIPVPTTFAYPGNAITPVGVTRLKELGFQFARRGGAPEFPYDLGRGSAYEPGRDHPLLIPSAGDARPDWTIDDFKRAVDQARNGRIAVLQFHGVPDRDHPWVHTDPVRFRGFMQHLKTNGFQVMAMRDLAKFVDPHVVPSDAEAVMRERMAGQTEALVTGEVLDAMTGAKLACRIAVRDLSGKWHYPRSATVSVPAVKVETRRVLDGVEVEAYTELGPQPFRVELPLGVSTLRVESGQEYVPATLEVVVKRDMPKVQVKLKRRS